MIFLIWVLHVFILLYEWQKKSISLIFWAMLLAVFLLPHTFHIIVGDYAKTVLDQATAFSVLFMCTYLIGRLVYFGFTKNKFKGITVDDLRSIPKIQINFFFYIYVISFLIIIIGFYARGFSLFSTTWTETLHSKITMIEYFARVVVLSFSGLGFVLFYQKGITNKVKFVIAALIFIGYFIITKSRYNLLGFITPFIIYYLFNNDKKKIAIGMIAGVSFILLVFFTQQMRWVGGFSQAMDVGFVELLSRSIKYMAEGNGEFGLVKAFYYYIEHNNNFCGFGEGQGYIRLALVLLPSSIAFFKPRDFAIDMYRVWFKKDISYGTMHPTLLGDLYANFGFKGSLLGLFYGLLISFVDENINNTRHLIIKVFKISLACTMLVMIGRGAIYNSIYNFIVSWIIVIFFNMLYEFAFCKIEGSSRYMNFEYQLFKTLKQHLILIVVISLLVGAGLGIYQNNKYETSYSATSTVSVDASKGEKTTDRDIKKSKELVDYYVKLGYSTSVLDKVIETIGNDVTVEDLSGKVFLTGSSDSMCIDIKVIDKNSDDAKRYAETVAECLKSVSAELRNEDLVKIISRPQVQPIQKASFLKFAVAGSFGGFFISWFILYIIDCKKNRKE